MSKSSQTDSPTSGRYQKISTRSEGPHGVEALEEVDPAELQQAVVSVLRAGDAVLLGTTRDGGAVAMQLYSGDNVDKVYAADPQELSHAFRAIIEAALGR